MSILTAANEPATQQQPRSRLFWVLLGAVAVSQLFAFWLLCSHQVRRAGARHNEEVEQKMAWRDSPQYTPGSTIPTCPSRRENNAQAAGQQGANPAMTGAVPVSFSYR